MNGEWRLAALIGVFSVADVLDGSLARYLNKDATSKFGAFLDSTTDRITEVLIFGGLVWWFAAETQPLYAALALLAFAGSILVSYARARAESLGFECKIGIFSRLERYLVLFVFGMLQQPEWCIIVMVLGTWITVFQRGWAVWQQARQA
jgi:CDP-diacylglycerol--glycerol-3-phosphate 3-phosphatidyltransferase